MIQIDNDCIAAVLLSVNVCSNAQALAPATALAPSSANNRKPNELISTLLAISHIPLCLITWTSLASTILPTDDSSVIVSALSLNEKSVFADHMPADTAVPLTDSTPNHTSICLPIYAMMMIIIIVYLHIINICNFVKLSYR